MTDAPKRSKAEGQDTGLECSQPPLDGWIDALRVAPGGNETVARGSSTGEGATTVVLGEDMSHSHTESGNSSASHRRSATELLDTPGALLNRSHLRELGLERRAIDAVFRTLAVVFLPGYSRPMIRAEEFLELVDRCTYRDDRVRPCHA
jgi:hypothetical protein